jgi:RNA polymerase sigma-70 factor (ECF subfamily)
MPRHDADLDMPVIKSYLAGDADSFNELVGRYERLAYNLAYRMTGNSADAADLTQEIFVRLHRTLQTFHGDSAFSTWFYRLAANCCKDWLRKEARRPAIHEMKDTLIADGGTGPSQHYEQKETKELVQMAISALPEEQRVAVILHDLQGYSYEEIATITEAPIGTVKSRLARARLKLAESLAAIKEQNGRLSV